MSTAKKKFTVPKVFVIPETIGGVIGLFTARGWERSAVVYAYTKLDKPGPKAAGVNVENPTNSDIEFPCSLKTFASLGISGLRDEHTVAFYRNQWEAMITKGKAKAVAPGDEIDLDKLADEKFPPTGHAAYPKTEYDENYATEAANAGTTTDAAKRVGQNPAAVAAAIKADPNIAKVASQALVEAEDTTHVEEVIKSSPKAAIAANKALNEKWTAEAEAQAHTGSKNDYIESHVDSMDGWASMTIKFDAVRRNLQDILGLAMNINGFAKNHGQVESTLERVEEVRNVLDAIASVAQGDSIDEGLAKLLEEGAK